MLGAVALSIDKTVKNLLFLDICGTVTKENTTLGFLRTIGIRASMTERIIGSILWRYFSYDYLRPKLLKRLAGKNQAELLSLSNDYVASLDYINEVIEIIDDYKLKGYKLVIISATIDTIANAIAKKFDAVLCYSSVLEYRDGTCTGRLSHDLLDNKLSYIKHLFQHNTAIITDNYGDYEIVAHCAEALGIAHCKNDEVFWGKNKVHFIRVK